MTARNRECNLALMAKKTTSRIVTCLSSIDFDALAASLCISKLYPGVIPVKISGVERPVQMFLGIYKDFIRLEDFEEYDPDSIRELFIVDTRPSKKVWDFVASFKNLQRCIIFDHHTASRGHTNCRLVQKEVGSTTTMLLPLLKLRKVYISPQEATVMLTGVYEDTTNLISPTTTPQDLEVAAYLLSLGASLQVVRRFLSTALDQRGKDILKQFLDNIEVVPMGGILIAISCVKYKDYVENLAFITHKLFDLVEADAIFTACSMTGNTYFVGRSLDDRLVDSAKVLSHFGGGGHKTASAAKIKGELDPKLAFYRIRKVCEEEIVPPPTITSIMSSPVKTVGPEVPVSEALKQVQRFGHGGLPVVNEDRLIGIITRRDLDRVPDEYQHRPVKRYMTTNVVTIDAGASIVEARRLMMKKSLGRLPVVSSGRVVGIVTRSDVLKASFWHRGQDIGPFPPPTFIDKTQTRELQQKVPASIQEKIDVFVRIANELGHNLYLVGGAVRDSIMDKEPTDLDILVEGDAVNLAKSAAEELGGKITTHERFGTARMLLDGIQYDFATARTEYYTEPGAYPNVIQSSIREDLMRRDFTINALALSLNGPNKDKILDYCGGFDDIATKKVRVLHNLSFVEDPTRILRAAYYSKILNFTLEKETKRLAVDAIKTGLLATAKNERTAQEFEKILRHEKGSEMLYLLEQMDGLTVIFGQLPDGLHQLLLKADRLAAIAARKGFKPDLRVLRCLVLGMAIDKGALRECLSRIRMSGKFIDTVEVSKEGSLVLSQAIGRGDRLEIFRSLKNLNDSAIVFACMGGKLPENLKNLDLVGKIRNIRLEITGEDLISNGLKKTKNFKAIIDQVLEQKVAGLVSGYIQELELARRIASE